MGKEANPQNLGANYSWRRQVPSRCASDPKIESENIFSTFFHLFFFVGLEHFIKQNMPLEFPATNAMGKMNLFPKLILIPIWITCFLF